MIRKGVSLITLVITVVVLIILAAAVILTLGNNNPINTSRVAMVAQTKDSIESGILTYVSSIKAKTLGELSTKTILLDSDTYNIVAEVMATIMQNNVEKNLYKIDYNDAKEKLNIEIKEETKNSWYIDEDGKVYLIYNDEESIPSYLKENGEIVRTLSGFLTYAKSIRNVPKLVKYSASDIAGITTEEEKQNVIGKSVKLTSKNGWNDWKVFSSDGTNIVLIAGDYVPVSLLSDDHGFRSGTYNSTYCVKSTTRNELLAKLSNSSTFNEFKDDDGKVIDSHIPTLQEFVASYNAVEHQGRMYNNNNGYPLIQKIYYKPGAYDGWNLAPNNSATIATVTSNETVPDNSYWAGYFSVNETNYKNLWVISDNTKAHAYWLNSASSFNNTLVLSIYYWGHVYYNAYNTDNRGLRPVVVLDSSVKLVQNIEGENITYTLE